MSLKIGLFPSSDEEWTTPALFGPLGDNFAICFRLQVRDGRHLAYGRKQIQSQKYCVLLPFFEYQTIDKVRNLSNSDCEGC
jgi:hypothetical protein